MAKRKSKMSYPVHFPYEDGWKFCKTCQRFYKTNSETCPHHPIMKLRKRSPSSTERFRRVWNDGLGLPIWARMREFTNTPEGEEAVNTFCEIQEKLIDKIRNAPKDKKITYGQLGAKRFRNHWFIRKSLNVL